MAYQWLQARSVPCQRLIINAKLQSIIFQNRVPRPTIFQTIGFQTRAFRAMAFRAMAFRIIRFQLIAVLLPASATLAVAAESITAESPLQTTPPSQKIHTKPPIQTLAEQPRIVISATPDSRDAFDLPASVDSIDAATLQRAGSRINLSEALVRVPGISVLNRQNYAQDLQISSRGFGARSTFGVRGVRLYTDGIPATMPDGQGQAANFDLDSAQRLEVLRGPFSALYGNSSGGVIQLFTEDGLPGQQLEAGMTAGSDGLLKQTLKSSGETGDFNHVLSLSNFKLDGYRQHSAAERQLLNAKVRYAITSDSSLTVLANALRMPEAQDPLGLSRSQFDANPKAQGLTPTGSAADYNTHKRAEQSQLGLVYKTALPTGELQLTAYAGQRDIRQFQSIPITAQRAVSSGGGVIDLQRRYHGLDLRYQWQPSLLDRPLRLSAGLSVDQMEEQRQGFENFQTNNGVTTLGVLGALRRDERNSARNIDPYLQAEWDLATQWMLSAGLRHSAVRFKSTDHYIQGNNGDDSGTRQFSASMPALGLLYRYSPDLNWYISAGKSAETPTLNEVAYRDANTQSTGLNNTVQASQGWHYETGVKARLGDNVQLNVALFCADINDEIAVLSNSGGRSVFHNVGKTRRQGAELSIESQPVDHINLLASLSYLDATYQSSFTPGSSGTAVPVGNRIPGTARTNAFAEVNWRVLPYLSTALELRHSGKIAVDDRNSDYANAYTIASLRWVAEQQLGLYRVQGLLRLDNLTNRRYSGSVIVNEANNRFFEPAQGRNWLAGMRVSRSF